MFFKAEPELFTNKDEYTETIPIQLGSNATLLCPFKNFDHFEWLKNSEIFDNSNNNNNSGSIDIIFHNISIADQGNFL